MELMHETKDLLCNTCPDESIADLTEAFVNSLPQKLANLQTHVRQGHIQEIARIAHQLAGAAGGYGFAELSHFASELEQLATSGATADDIANKIQILEKRLSATH